MKPKTLIPASFQTALLIASCLGLVLITVLNLLQVDPTGLSDEFMAMVQRIRQTIDLALS